MSRDEARGFLSAIRCVHVESEQWAKLAKETQDVRARAVMIAVAEAFADAEQRMIDSLVKAGELTVEEVLRS